MKNFEEVLAAGNEVGVFKTINELEAFLRQILSAHPGYELKDDGNDHRWCEILDDMGGLAALIHCYYRVAFVESFSAYEFDGVHCETVEGFDAPEWSIDDVDALNARFPELKWDSYKGIAPDSFSLLDMQIATE